MAAASSRIPIAEPTEFQTYFAYRKDATLSSFCEFFIAALRSEMQGRRRKIHRDRRRERRLKAAATKSNIRFAIYARFGI